MSFEFPPEQGGRLAAPDVASSLRAEENYGRVPTGAGVESG